MKNNTGITWFLKHHRDFDFSWFWEYPCDTCVILQSPQEIGVLQ